MKILRPNKSEKTIIIVVTCIAFGFFIGVLAEKHQTAYKGCEHYHDYDNYQCEEMMEHLDILNIIMDNELKEKDEMRRELEKLKRGSTT